MEEVLQKHGNHRMRCNSGIISGQSDPKAFNALISNAFSEAIDQPTVRQLSIRS